jgi:hypothetical protein
MKFDTSKRTYAKPEPQLDLMSMDDLHRIMESMVPSKPNNVIPITAKPDGKVGGDGS